MPPIRPITAIVIGAALLAAWSGGGSAAPGSTSADEDRQLNEAAAMLDANSIDLEAVSPAAADESAPQ